MNRSGMNVEVIMAIARGIYELPEILGLNLAIRPGDRILELGSGLGVIAVLAAKLAKPMGRVLSFEANPQMIPETIDFLASHGIENVELRHAVLVPSAGADETREFHLAGSFASSSLLGASGPRARGSISAPAKGIENVIVEFRPDVLICDIEGGETELIPALDASGLRAVVIELHPDRLSAEQIAAIYSALGRHGLRQSAKFTGGTVIMFNRDPSP